MDWGFVHKTWDKWASTNIGPRLPLKAALLINYDPTAPSRLLSTLKELKSISLNCDILSTLSETTIISRLRASILDPISTWSQQFMRTGLVQGASTHQNLLGKVR